MTTTPAVDERVAVTRRPASYEEYLAWSSETRFAEWVGGEMIEYMPPLPDYQRRLGSVDIYRNQMRVAAK